MSELRSDMLSGIIHLQLHTHENSCSVCLYSTDSDSFVYTRTFLDDDHEDSMEEAVDYYDKLYCAFRAGTKLVEKYKSVKSSD